MISENERKRETERVREDEKVRERVRGRGKRLDDSTQIISTVDGLYVDSGDERNRVVVLCLAN
ncbi:unnamed protein product [Camellia sinensis]